MAAVKALALVAHKLYSISSREAADPGSQSAAESSVEADPAAAVLIREHVVNVLLAAVEDYSTDNRSGLADF